MAEAFWRNNGATEVAPVKTFQITAVGTTDTWTFTVTLEDGSTYTGVTYTEDGTPSVNEVAAGLQAAWAADTNPFVQQITATVNTDTVTLTGTAGVPMNVTLASSGTGTDTETETTAVVSNTNYDGDANWSTDAEPTTNDDVRITSAGTSKNILYGLDQSAAAIDEFRVLEAYNGQIGKFQFGQPFYLKIDPNSFEYYARSSLAMIDTGATGTLSPYIEVNGSPTSGKKALYLKGTNYVTLEIVKGVVGVAVLPGETATVTTILCSYKTNIASDVDLEIGSGVTLTTLTQSGGRCLLKCAATTVNNSKDTTLTTEGSGAIGTLNVYGTTYANSTGTITTCNLAGTLDLRGDRGAKTITTLNVIAPPEGSSQVPTLITHANVTISTLNLPSPAEGGVFKYIAVL